MGENLYSEFKSAAEHYGGSVFVYQPQGSGYLSKTFREAFSEIESLSASLAALKLKRGSKVGLLSENRYEWWVAYLAAVSLGLVVVPLDAQALRESWIRFLKDSNAEILFLSDRFRSFAPELIQGAPTLKEVVLFGDPLPDLSRVKSYASLLKEAGGEAAEIRRPPLVPDDIASLVYTSGTNGMPRGVELTHRNLLSNARVAAGWGAPELILATILPMHHIYGFTTTLGPFLQGQSVVFFPTLQLDTLLQTFQEIKPHFLAGVPAFYERIGNGIRNRIFSEMPHWLRPLLLRAMNGRPGKSSSSFGPLKKILFKKVHQRFGGRIRHMVSGGAPLEPSLIRLFNLLGIKVFEGYGLTETSPIVSCNDDRSYRIGSVGRPVEGVKIKIDRPDDGGVGEICVKGPGVMKGYYKDPGETRRVMNPEGWFRTGDIGHIDRDGFLFISGRKKEVIVTPNGKKIFPDELERIFGRIKLVKEVSVFGVSKKEASRQELIHVQVLPDLEEAKRQGISNVEFAVKEEIARLARELPDYKRPTSVGFSKDPFPRTTTLKIKKFEVKEAYLRERRKESVLPVRTEEEALRGDPVGALVLKLLRSAVPEEAAITADSLLTLDLGLDSLTTIEFWTSLEQIYGIAVPDEERFRMERVGQIVAYLRNRPELGRGGERLTARAESIGEADWSRIIETDPEEVEQVVESTLRFHARARRLFLKTFRAFFKRFSHLRACGLENLPAQGPYIFAPNHESHFDNVFLACLLPPSIQENMVVLGKKEHFEHPLARIIAELCYAIPVDRSRVSQFVLRLSAQLLKQGRILLIHPEGTRSPDGELQPFKHGAALLANYVQCPIVPVYIEGAYEFLPKGAWFPKSRSDISITIGRPLYPRSHPVKGAQVLAEAERLTDELVRRLRELKEQASSKTR
jgi:long-chain acyl-CoA synthetase